MTDDRPVISDLAAHEHVVDSSLNEDRDLLVAAAVSRGTVRLLTWLYWAIGIAVAISLVAAMSVLGIVLWHMFGPSKWLWLEGERFDEAREFALVGALPVVFMLLQRTLNEFTRSHQR